MKTYQFDVIIIGAGPAGIAAAGTLAGSGISVAVIEAGAYAGAENWSGCVYFAESLAEPDCFGPAAVQQAPFERPVIRRGTLLHNGLDEIGVSLTDPAVFRHCYTVLRPVYDPYFAALCRAKGAVFLAETTVLSLIRKAGTVIGVSTDRGPLYAGVVFLAEGDASHLVRAEGMERVASPHYLQGVKAVLSLPAAEIEKRFNLRQGEGAAFEILVRNGAIAGRTAKLNAGGFLYTNRDSLSLGYVVPLDNLKKNFRGDHSRLLEWMRGLPHLAAFVKDAGLSAYGAKIIRSGGWRERPVLVENGLAVGGAATGLGIDIPFPNFTGPAAASGLYFGRAVKRLLREGRSLDEKNLTEAYLRPLEASVYGKNSRYLSRWPGYFSRSSSLFGRTTDVFCGTAHFLSSGGMTETGRFLQSHMLSLRGIREIAMDTAALLGSLRLGKPLAKTILHPATIGSWFKNLVISRPEPDPRLRIIMNIGSGTADPFSLPWPLGGLLRRIEPALAKALATVYANDDVPAERKFRTSLRIVARSLSIADLFSLPLFGIALGMLAAGTALRDAFRYYVLKMPVEQFLAQPVRAYAEAQRKARDIDAVRPAASLEVKLATNTYRVGGRSHIRTLWPEQIAHHADLAQAGIWWVCPARVYGYEAPLAGRGKVAVNWENCIKCESCWRAEPAAVLWGRFTDHRLIYRPQSAAITDLLLRTRELAATTAGATLPREIDKTLWYTAAGIPVAANLVRSASAAFRDAVAGIPLSADMTRRDWAVRLGERLAGRMMILEAQLHGDGHHDAALDIEEERASLTLRLREGRLFHALATVTRIEQRLQAWLPAPAEGKGKPALSQPELGSAEIAKVFPDRVVKQWEEEPMPAERQEQLRNLIEAHRHPARPLIRLLSSISPALGWIAACQAEASRILARAGREPIPGLCAVTSDQVSLAEKDGRFLLSGTAHLVPTAAMTGMLLKAGGRGYIVPFTLPGITLTPTPAIGFRAAGLSDVALSCSIEANDAITLSGAGAFNSASYLTVALGAGDYLSRRCREHAAGRVQFAGQLLDTEGRDGIAKFGAVKAMVSRVEAWRLLLEALYDATMPRPHAAIPSSPPELALLAAAAAARAFGPENGSLAYDAGQVFGGFAYSEDDLLSRFYRDSSLFRFLAPGHNAAALLHAALGSRDLSGVLTAELGALPSEQSLPLGPLAQRWAACKRRLQSHSFAANPQVCGEAQAILLGTKALLARTEGLLEGGKSAEAETASVAVLLGLAENAVMRASLSAGWGGVSPWAVFPLEPAVEPAVLDIDYPAFCSLPAPAHRSGQFLMTVFDRRPRYLPEMQLHDPGLRKRWTELTTWFRRNCRDRSFDGKSFERHIEAIHNLPPEIIEAAREKKWLATYIPQDLDGLGWRKADYYVLNSTAGSFGDASVCLLIMASTSIGTTPVLLGLEEELPRVREELEPLAKDEKRLGEIGSRISRIVASFRNPNPARIRKEYEAVMRLVDSRIRRTRVVKYLAANFLRAFYGAGLAGRRGDFGGFRTNLEKAADLFTNVMPDVRASLDELPRRERCHKLFLRMLGHKAISAFALTEPTAGSDSGGVKTTAALRSVPLTALPDGRYAFTPAAAPGTTRYLIDADRIVFTDAGMCCRTPDGRDSAIRYDRYDYATDEGVRYFEHAGTACEFHDIGQARLSDAGPVYEYYELTGAKMWITNASIATQFSLFAQTPEGVTGFMVDRHAEGLKVGADERKTGQRGSPTNEIALDSVRVPREAVIGYEGHGQVNALETLNAGRCGLAVVAGALGRKVLNEARETLPPSETRDALLGEAAAVLFGSESLAYYLIGLFDRPHESVRMESAIAKFACSEDVHEVLSLAERALGPLGQTERHLVEKARRDARILNIYEGTNEVQRFLILKDLIGMASEWPELPEKLTERPDDEHGRTLARWKNRVRHHAQAAASLLGDAAWSDAMLQPGLFPLAEMAGQVLRLECVWYRMEWLAKNREKLGEEYADPLLSAGNRAAGRSVTALEHLERTFTAAWEAIASGRDLAEVQAADALLDKAAIAPAGRVHRTDAGTASKILVILRPVADLSPAPLLDRGHLREILWKIDPLDRAGLSEALALRDRNEALVVHALVVGGPDREELLRTEGAPANRLFRLDAESADPATIAASIGELCREQSYDLVLCGNRTLDGFEGLAPYLAGYLVELQGAPEVRAVAVPPAARIAPASSLVEALRKDVTVIPVSEPRPPLPVFSSRRAISVHMPIVTTVPGAARFLREYAATIRATVAEPYGEAVIQGALPAGPRIWAIVDPTGGKENKAVLQAAATAGSLFGMPVTALVSAPRELWPQLLGLCRQNGASLACCIDTGTGMLSATGRQLLLERLSAESPMIVAPTAWNAVLSRTAGLLAGRGERTQCLLNAWSARRGTGGVLQLDLPAYEGKLLRNDVIGDTAAFLSFLAGGEDGEAAPAPSFSAVQAELTLPGDGIADLPPAAAPSLAAAEVIIDLGYGIRDRAGLALAEDLRRKLRQMGIEALFGATRKVTQDLKLQPLEAQIGQTGLAVNPKLIIALGISGAPQHIDWIGTRADVLCFNKDPEAPLMKLGAARPAPRVHPIPGDLFVTVKELIRLLEA